MEFNIGDEVVFNHTPDMRQIDYLCIFNQPYTILDITQHGIGYLLHLYIEERKEVLGITSNLFTLYRKEEKDIIRKNISQQFEEKVKEINNGLF